VSRSDDPTAEHPGRRPEGDARGAWLALAVVLGAVLVILGWMLRAGPLPLDESIAGTVMSAYPAQLTAAFDLAASLPGAVAAALVLLGVALLQYRPAFAVAVIVGVTSEIPTAVVKAVIDRPRPPGGATVEAFGSAASYPSGHTERAVVFAGLAVIFLIATRHRLVATVLAVVFVALVGLARIASGEHWPSDVVGGYLLGSAWLIVAVLVGRVVGDRLSGRVSA
jgi:undecaprenyl-diphosphatase